MCVLALAWRAHPHWRLVLAGNRDELHARPAAPLARWDEPAHIIAGRDLKGGGTWLGVSEHGRLAVVTNLRGFGPPDPQRASRGALVRDLLAEDGAFADADRTDLCAFNPFNLILIDGADARVLSNRPRPASARLAPDIHGLSNGARDEPSPRTRQLQTAMRDWLTDGAAHPQRLLAALASQTRPESPTAQDTPQEALLTPVFIRNPVYGTRCSTVVAIDSAGQGHIVERRFNAAGAAIGDSTIRFRWPD